MTHLKYGEQYGDHDKGHHRSHDQNHDLNQCTERMPICSSIHQRTHKDPQDQGGKGIETVDENLAGYISSKQVRSDYKRTVDQKKGLQNRTELIPWPTSQ